MSLLTKIVRDPTRRELKRHQAVVETINALEEKMQALDDSALRAKTAEFRERLGVTGTDLSYGQSGGQSFSDDFDGEDEEAREQREERDAEMRRLNQERRQALDELLPEAFAVVREAARRVLGMRHFDVQLIGGMVLHEGRIAEMKTGEGKTLVATLALYLNALEAKGAHLVTVNDYLARRDAGWNAPLFHFLGMSTGIIIPGPEGVADYGLVYDPEYEDTAHPDPRLQHLRPCSRRDAYACDITYATNNEIGFDYLRDNMARSLAQCVQRQLHYAIVDEVDSILIDEARTPLIISGTANEPTEKYYTYARLIPRLVAEEDYTADEKTKSVALTDEGAAKIEQWTGIGNVFDLEHVDDAHKINQALKAHVHFLRDREYIVRDNEVIIVDEFTGRTMPGRRWSDGLHQAIEAKEGVRVNQENVTLATITFQNLFRIYHKLAGMTGTALTEAEEFHKIYNLDVVPIPTHKPMVRIDATDVIYKNEEAKFRAIGEEITERHKSGQPVLVGTTSIEKSEKLSRLLEKRGVPHSVLNAKYHEREAQIVADAGQPGAVTIATNMAGRGTDIVLGEGVAGLGGLYIIGTERHESRRIDNQLRGRAGRQGDPGETRFFLSFGDDVMRIFGGERMQGLMDRLHIEEDVPIENRLVARQIEGAQSRVEGYHFDSRRSVVEYDDVMNRQREIIYGERRKILEGTDTKSNLVSMIEKVVKEEVLVFCPGRHREDWDLEGLWQRMRTYAPLAEVSEVNLESLGSDVAEIEDTLINELVAIHEEKEKQHGAEAMRAAEQAAMIEVIDSRWRAYLTEMQHLREGIGLRGHAQMDPLMEYKQEAFTSFQELTGDIQRDIVRLLLQSTIRVEEAPAPVPQAALEAKAPATGRADAGAAAGAGPGMPPAARPAAAVASGALARAKFTPATTEVRPLPPLPVMENKVTNIVESSSQGLRRLDAVVGNGAKQQAGGVPAAAGRPGKVGRNQPCPCGSGKKYKLCHGR